MLAPRLALRPAPRVLATAVALLGAAAPAVAGTPLAERPPFDRPPAAAGADPARGAPGAALGDALVTVDPSARPGVLEAAGARPLAREIGVWTVRRSDLPRLRRALRRNGVEAVVEPDRRVGVAAVAAVPGSDPYSLDARWDLVDARGLVPPDPLGAYRPSWVIDSGIASDRLFDVVEPAAFTASGARIRVRSARSAAARDSTAPPSPP